MTTVIERNVEALWGGVCEILKGRLSQPSYETWIASLSFSNIENDQVVLETTSDFNRDWVMKHYRSHLMEAFQAVLSLDTLPQLVINVAMAAQPEAATAVVEQAPIKPQTTWLPKAQQSLLNPRYTFDQFVVGSHNRFAHAAALAVAETPAQSYNPLFLYGGVGLGKTHLMQAIGHYISQNLPDQKVKYVTTEQFTNDLIHALGNRSMKQFRDKYRRIDVLLVDDVQFLEGKDRTQEELFHTFNTLHQAGKQVILSSDRPPSRLSRLEDRLRSRFSWGLIADIQPPDYETRLAILTNKSQFLNLSLPDEVLQYVAESFPGNIRELEGALNKLSAYRMLTGCEIDLVQSQTLLGRRFDPTRLSKETMMETTARYYHLQLSDLKSQLRTKHIAHARQVAIYVVRELTEASFPQIGGLFGGRKHTTMLYAYEKMKEQMASDATLKQQVHEIIDQIKHSADV